MNKPTLSKVKFKSYEQHQSQLFPSSLDEWIPENHLVRLISSVLDKMELDSVLQEYPGGGAPSYHPKMMLKVLIYAYTQKLYSSRQIAKALPVSLHSVERNDRGCVCISCKAVVLRGHH